MAVLDPDESPVPSMPGKAELLAKALHQAFVALGSDDERTVWITFRVGDSFQLAGEVSLSTAEVERALLRLSRPDEEEALTEAVEAIFAGASFPGDEGGVA